MAMPLDELAAWCEAVNERAAEIKAALRSG